MGYWHRTALSQRTRFFGSRVRRNRIRAAEILGRPPAAADGRMHFEPLEPRYLLAADIFEDDLASYLAGDDPDFGTNMLAELGDGFDDIEAIVDSILGDADFSDPLEVELPGLLDRTDPMDFARPTLAGLLELADGPGGGAQSLGDIVNDNIDDIIDGLSAGIQGDDIATAIEAALDGLDVDPDSEGFAIASTAAYAFDSAGQSFDFDVSFDISRTETFSFDFGRNADPLGLGYLADDPAATAGIPLVDLTATLSFDMAFGIAPTIEAIPDQDDADPLTDPLGDTRVTTDDSFFLEGIDVAVTVSATADPGNNLDNFFLQLGILDLDVTGFDFELDVAVEATVADPAVLDETDPTETLSAAELADAATSGGSLALDDIVEIADPTGSLHASVTVEVTPIPGVADFFSNDALGTPTINVDVDEIFSADGLAQSGDDPRTAPAVTLDGFDALTLFTNIDETSLINAVTDVGSFLGGLENTPLSADGLTALFGTSLPFAENLQLSDLLNFGDMVQDLASGLLMQVGDAVQPNFGSFQEFIDVLGGELESVLEGLTADQLAGLPGELAALQNGVGDFSIGNSFLAPDFDFDTGDLTFRIQFRESFGNAADPDEDKPGFAATVDLGPVGDITVEGLLEFETALDIAFVLGLDLGDPNAVGQASVPEIIGAFAPLALGSLVSNSGVFDPTASQTFGSNTRFKLDFGGLREVVVDISDQSFADLAALVSELQSQVDAGLAALAGDPVSPVEIAAFVDTIDADGSDVRLTVFSPDASALRISNLGDATEFGKLGFADQQRGASSFLPADGQLSGDAAFEVQVGDVTANVSVLAADTSDNTVIVGGEIDQAASLDNLASDIETAINDALNTAAGTSGVAYVTADIDSATGDPLLRIVADDPATAAVADYDLLRIDLGVSGAEDTISANELGLQDDSISGRFAFSGDRDVAVAVNEAGAAANALPSTKGGLSGSIELTIDLDSLTDGDIDGVSETFDLDLGAVASSVADGASAAQVAAAVAGAVNDILEGLVVAGGQTLADLIDVSSEAFLDGSGAPTGAFGLTFSATSAAVDGFDLTLDSAGLGYGAGTIAADREGPASDGSLSGAATFNLELLDNEGGVSSETITVASQSTLNDLVDALRTAVDAEFGADVVEVGTLGGRIVFGLVTTDTGGTAQYTGMRIAEPNAVAADELGLEPGAATRSIGAADAFLRQATDGSDNPIPIFEASARVEGEAAVDFDFGLVGLSGGAAALLFAGITWDPSDAGTPFEISFRDLFAPTGTPLADFGDESLESVLGLTDPDKLSFDTEAHFSIGAGINDSGLIDLTDDLGLALQVGSAAASDFINDLTDELAKAADLPYLLFSLPDFMPTLDGDTLVAAVVDFVNDFEFDLGGLGDFQDVSADDILFILRQLGESLLELANWDILDQPLPVVGITLNDGLDFVDDFLEAIGDIEQAGIEQIQGLIDRINDAFGDFELFDVELGYETASPGVLTLDVGFARSLARTLPLNISLDDLASAIGISLPGDIVDLSGQANLDAAFDLDIGLKLGAEIEALATALSQGQVANALDFLSFDLSETGIDLTAFAGADNVSFTAALGPFGAFVQNGAAILNGNGELGDLTPASLSVDLVDPNDLLATDLSLGDFFDAIGSGDFLDLIDVDGGFGVGASLPTFFPTADNFIGLIAFEGAFDAVTNAFAFDTDSIQLPDFNAPDIAELFADLGILDGINLVVEGLDIALSSLSDLVTGELFGLDAVTSLPFVGDALDDIAGFFDDIRNEVIQPVLEALDAAPEIVTDILIQIQGLIEDAIQAVGDLFGGSVDLVIETAGGLVDFASSLIDTDPADVIDQIEDIIDDALGFYFDISFDLSETFSLPDVDFGLPLLGFEIDDPIDLSFALSLGMAIGFNLDEGVFIDFTNAGASDDVDAVNADLEASIELFLPDYFQGTLGFLQVEAENLSPDDVNLGAYFAADIADGRLSFADFSAFDPTIAFAAVAEADYALRLGLADAIGGGGFPSLLVGEGVADAGSVSDLLDGFTFTPGSGFFFNWGFAANLDDADSATQALLEDIGDAFGETFADVDALNAILALTPQVDFGNVGMDLGSFLGDLIGPIVEDIQEYLGPIQPLLDLVSDPIPVISDLVGDTSLLDLAAQFGALDPSLVTALEFISDLLGTINDLEVGGFTNNLILPFGSIGLGSGVGGLGLDLSDPSAAADLFDPSVALNTALEALGIDGAFGDLVDDVVGAIGGFVGGLGGMGGGTASAANTLFQTGDVDLAFPFLNDPAQVFGLLFGRDMNLVTLDLPPLTFGFDYDVFVPIWGPLGAQFGGGVSATFDFGFGYDTFGFREFAGNDFRNPFDIFKGFFIADDSPIGSGVDTPEITLSAEITAAAVVNIVVASAGVGGGIFADIFFDLNDPDNDFKIRFDELYANIENGIDQLGFPAGLIGIFDTSGEVRARLFAFIEALFGAFEKRWYFGPEAPLIEFSFDVPRDPILASEVGGGVLRLNMGDFAEDRVHGDIIDGDEEFVVTSDGSNNVAVTAFGRTQTFSGVTEIQAFAGEGDDLVDFSGVQAGGGIVVLAEGGAGNDRIFGGGAMIDVSGEAGDDLLTGGTGDDLIDGGQGSDRLFGQGGADKILGDTGDDLIVGGAGADFLRGGDGGDVIDGEDGIDIVLGELGSDLLTGGGDGDFVDGGRDVDSIWGDLGFSIAVPATTISLSDATRPIVSSVAGDNPYLLVDAGTGRPVPADLDDTVTMGQDYVAGGGGSDFIQADGGDDYVWADFSFQVLEDICALASESEIIDERADFFVGAQSLTADAGDGVLVFGEAPELRLAGFGEEGNDVISGGGGSDLIVGGGGQDVIRGDTAHEVDDAGAVLEIDRLEQGAVIADGEAAGDDIIIAGRGADIAYGDGGDDQIRGGLEGDWLFGNAGDDIVSGDQGVDVIFGDDGVVSQFVAGDTINGGGSYAAFTTDLKVLETLNPGVNGDDTLSGGRDGDYLFGGPDHTAGDVISAGDGDDVAFGDNGIVTFQYDADIGRSMVVVIQSKSHDAGGNDQIAGETGRDILIGGAGGDTIDGDLTGFSDSTVDSRDIIFGDHGKIEFDIVPAIRASLMTNIISDEQEGLDAASQVGVDTIDGGFAKDIIIGGGAGDDITGGDDDDIIIGDRGQVTLELGTFGQLPTGDEAATGFLSQVDYLQLVDLIQSLDTVVNPALTPFVGDDVISGGDRLDVVIGGGGNDEIDGDDVAGAQGQDILIGDNGRIEFFNDGDASNGTTTSGEVYAVTPGMRSAIDVTPRARAFITATDTAEATGGVDTILGDGEDDVLIGGVGGDMIVGSLGDDIAIGDNGDITFARAVNSDGVMVSVRDLIETTGFSDGGTSLGGVDEIDGDDGDDVIIGGSAGDILNGGADIDLIIGDQGEVDYDASAPVEEGGVVFSRVERIETTDREADDGDVDTIAGDGDNDVAIGGVAGDFISGDGGDDILIGDLGRVLYQAGPDADPETPDVIESKRADDDDNGATSDGTGLLGGVDRIFGDGGRDLIIGGTDADVLLGDNSEADPVGAEGVYDVAPGDAAADIIVGDQGRVELALPDGGQQIGFSSFLNSNVTAIMTRDTAETDGGADFIEGNAAGDVILGGVNGSTATVETLVGDTRARIGGELAGGDDIILGDEGRIVISLGDNDDGDPLTPDLIETLRHGRDPDGGALLGGVDLILGQAGRDAALGGSEADVIIGDNSESGVDEYLDAPLDGAADILVGDQGSIELQIPDGGQAAGLSAFINTNITRIVTTDALESEGGDDLIHGDQGGDVLIGGVGADVLHGDGPKVGVNPDPTDADDIAVGDEAELLYNLEDANDGYPPEGDDDPGSLDEIRTLSTGVLGAGDVIRGGDGRDILIGGSGGDDIFGDQYELSASPVTDVFGDDLLIGDGGLVFRLNDAFAEIQTITPNMGGVDRMQGDEGEDVLLGGFAGDRLHGEAPDLSQVQAGFGGGDVILGDNGMLSWIATAATVVLPAGATVVPQDEDVTTLDVIQTLDPTLGGADVIVGNARGDILIGGTGTDAIAGDSVLGDPAGPEDASAPGPDGPDGDDLIFGDHAIVMPAVGALIADPATQDPDALALLALLGSNVFYYSQSTDEADLGAGDMLFGNDGADIMIGGQGDDAMFGQAGDDDMIGGHNIPGTAGVAGEPAHDELDDLTAADIDAIVAELAQLAGQPFTLADLNPADVAAANDVMDGGVGDDVMVGDNGLIERQTASYLLGAPVLFVVGAHDAGQSGTDVGVYVVDTIADLYGMFDLTSPRFQGLAGDGLGGLLPLYSEIENVDFDGLIAASGAPLVSLAFQLNIANVDRDHLDMLLVRDTTIFDHTAQVLEDALAAPTDARPFGNDIMVGGLDDDEMFGGLGDDAMQGDGDLALNASALTPVGTLIEPPLEDDTASQDFTPAQISLPDQEDFLTVTDLSVEFLVSENLDGGGSDDGNDYLEGNSGSDRMYGNLGQDDIIGGSSSLFGLSLGSDRPDGADLIYGGAANGSLLNRNAGFGEGEASPSTQVPEAERHGEDADTILGDNGDVHRIVDATGAAELANYANPTQNALVSTSQFDLTGYEQPVVTRGVALVDYGYAYAVVGDTASLTFAGTGAGDLIFGESGDDVIHGMTGDDVAYGNSEDDDLYGEHGADFLFGGTGIDGILGDDGLITTRRNSDLFGEELFGVAALAPDQTGTLKRNETADPGSLNAVIKTPGNIQLATINVEGELVKSAELTAYRADPLEDGVSFNDIIFGGLGTDFIHSGDGDDAVSGAEALPFYYDASVRADGAASDFSEVNAVLIGQQQYDAGAASAPPAPTVQETPFWVNFAPVNPGAVLNKGGAGKSDEFAYYDEFNPRRKILLDIDFDPVVFDADKVYDFILNFDPSEGPMDARFATTVDPDGAGVKATDGDDRIFGDLGHDWLVGGTGRDHMYGGRGDDMLNMDDDHDTPTFSPKPKPKQVEGDLENNQPDEFQAYADIVYAGAGRDVMILNGGMDRAIDWVGEFNSYIVPFSPFGAFHNSRNLSPHVEEFVLDLSAADGADQTMPDGTLYVDQKRVDVRTDDPELIRNYEPFGELGMVRQEDRDWGDQTGAPNDPQAGNIQGKREVMRRELFQDPATLAFAADAGDWSLEQGRYMVAPESSSLTDGVSFLHDVALPSYAEILVSISAAKDKAGVKSNGYVIFDWQGPESFKFAGLEVGTDKVQIGERTAAGWEVQAQSNLRLQANADYDVTVALHGGEVVVYVDGAEQVSHGFADPVQFGLVALGANNSITSFDDFQIQVLPPVQTFEFVEDFASGAGDYVASGGTWSTANGVLTGVSDASGTATSVQTLPVLGSSRVWVGAEVDTAAMAGVAFDHYGPDEFKFAAVDAANDRLVIGHVDGGVLIIDAETAFQTNGSEAITVELLGAGAVLLVDGQPELSHAFNALLNDGAFGAFVADGSADFASLTVAGDDPAYQVGEALRASTIGDGGGEQLTQETLDAAVASFEPRLDTDAATQFIVGDLAGDLLAVTREDGVVIVDRDAAGHGWYIDPTPLIDEAGEVDGIDLLSVIAHELGHVEGEDHADDGVMAPYIDVDVRTETSDFTFGDDWVVVESAPAETSDGSPETIDWADGDDAVASDEEVTFLYAVSKKQGVVKMGSALQ